MMQQRHLGKFPGYNDREYRFERSSAVDAASLATTVLFREDKSTFGKSAPLHRRYLSKVMPYDNKTGVTTVLSENSPPLFVCMILPGGGCRLQTCSGLTAELFNSTLRTLNVSEEEN